MSFPTVFANLAAGNQPASLLDTMFNILGGAAPIPTTATGTNAITLTPNTNQYVPAAYANYQPVTFTAAASLTGAATIRIGALAFVKLFMPTGIQANSGDITINTLIVAIFNSALDSGSGGFIVINATTPSVIQPVAGTFKNLVITNGGTPDTQILVTADEVMLENTGGGTLKAGFTGASPISVTISSGTSGANGLDSGAMANNTFYSVWIINNGTTTSGLISLSATSPTMPSGYTYKARVGWVRTGAASTNFHRTRQLGREARYVVTAASQTLNLPNIVNGTQGSVSVPTWVSETVAGASSFVPTTAAAIWVVMFCLSGSTGAAQMMTAPNNTYGAVNSSTNPPPASLITPAGQIAMSTLSKIILESTAIFVAGAIGTGVGTGIGWFVYGWEDNI